jgi:hypothetical protein
MINQALFDVVKNQLASGVSEQAVKEFLRRRGTSEVEIQELFEAIASRSVTIRDIPVSSPSPEQAPLAPLQTQDEPISLVSPEQIAQPAPMPQAVPTEPVAVDMPVQSEAHGIVRDIPPLQPSAPFTPFSQEQLIAAQPSMPIGNSIAPSVVFESEGPTITPTRRKTVVLVSAGIIGLIVLAFGGFFVYSSYFASPEKILDTMVSRLRDVRSGEFSLDVTVVTNSMNELASTSTQANPFLKAFAIQGPVTFTSHASGTVNVLDEQKPKFALTFTSTMDKWPMGDFVLGVEYRNIDRVNYVRLNSVPDLGFLSLSFLKNKWFKAGDSEAKAQLGASSSNGSSSVIPTVSQEQRDRLVAAWQAHRFLAVAEVLDSEDIDGASMHHYRLAFDKEALKQLNAETNQILNRSVTAVETAKVDENLDLTTINNLEIWIGKRDGLPHRFILNASLQDKGDQSKKSEVTITMGGGKFNTALDVAVPEGVQSVEEAIKGVFGQMLGGDKQKPAPVTLKDRNNRRKSDVIVIADAIKKNMMANNGTFVCSTGPLPVTATFMGAAGFGMSGYAIESCLVPVYLQEMPRDPSKGTTATTGYSVLYNLKTKKVTVRAPYTEGGSMISITK